MEKKDRSKCDQWKRKKGGKRRQCYQWDEREASHTIERRCKEVSRDRLIDAI